MSFVPPSNAWQWDSGRTDKEIRALLKNPRHPSFIHYSALLLARMNVPKAVFAGYLSKETFCLHWLNIKRRMRKDRLNQERIQFWEEIYRHLKEEMKIKGIRLRQPSRLPVQNSLKMKIAKRIREVRESKNMTQADAAEGTGLTQQYLSKIEQGTENVSLDTLERIQNFFKEDLF
jgi:DNA-binding XRE family transcriptional regulator